MTRPFSDIKQAISTLQNGGMIILVDDEKRENEGDLVVAAQFATAEKINFMARYGRGLICLPMEPRLIDRLRLPMMTQHNHSPYGTAFTVSIEAATGVSTGISAQDRAKTIAVAIHPESAPDDLISPGHIFPLRAHPSGVLKRAGQTEGSVDLTRLAGLIPAAVICEVMNEDGSMSRQADLQSFSQQHQIPLITIKDLIDYRISHEVLVKEVASSRLPLEKYGAFTMRVFQNELDSAEHFVLIKTPSNPHRAPLVRIHSECITGDVFGSAKCDCGWQLNQSLAEINKEGGLLVYLRQEGRGIGLSNKLKAYALQEQGYDTVEANIQLGFPADARDYSIAFQILKYLGLGVVRLLTNNPKKVETLENYGIQVIERVPLTVEMTVENQQYLKTKKQKLGHLFSLEEDA